MKISIYPLFLLFILIKFLNSREKGLIITLSIQCQNLLFEFMLIVKKKIYFVLNNRNTIFF